MYDWKEETWNMHHFGGVFEDQNIFGGPGCILAVWVGGIGMCDGDFW